MEIKEVTMRDFVLYLTRFLGGKREEEGDGRRGWERKGGGVAQAMRAIPRPAIIFNQARRSLVLQYVQKPNKREERRERKEADNCA